MMLYSSPFFSDHWQPEPLVNCWGKVAHFYEQMIARLLWQEGTTALMFACMAGNTEVVQLLVGAGANVEAQDGEVRHG